MTFHSTLNCSSTMIDILLEGVREMIGSSTNKPRENTLYDPQIYNKLEKRGHLSDTISELDLVELLHSAQAIYGNRGSFGVALRIGEASFRYFLRKKGEEYSLSGNSYRLMNSQQRTLFGLKKLAEFANENSNAETKISENETYWHWNVELKNQNFMVAQIFKSFTVGLLREFFSWSSGGRFFPIEDHVEQNDDATNFRISISKQPLGN